MPCTGPIPPADAHVERVSREVMQFLAEKHQLLKWEPDHHRDKELREEVWKKVKTAVREVIVQDGFECF